MATKKVEPNVVKVDDKSLEELRNLRLGQQRLQIEVGAVETHKAALVTEITKFADKISSIMRELEEKYGKGNLNLETGIIIPLEEKVEENVNS